MNTNQKFHLMGDFEEVLDGRAILKIGTSEPENCELKNACF
jgi:hypothetical protein